MVELDEVGNQIVKKGLLYHVMTFVGQKTLIGCKVLVRISEALKMMGSLQNSEGHQFATGLDAAALGTVEGLENELGLM